MEKIKFQFLLILLSSILLTQIYCKLEKEKVVIAINCGGPKHTDSDGIEYMKVKINKLK